MYLLKYMLVTALFIEKKFMANSCTFFLCSYQNSDILKTGHTFGELKFDN
ncbi:hypothetical protein SN4111_16760 [Ligilactobacillus agilis]|nr:hypothetical protein SN4111_16760 [Ligilactobacillus agilis]